MRKKFTKLRFNDRLIKNSRLVEGTPYKCPMCDMDERETVSHFLLYCPYYKSQRDLLYQKISRKSKRYKFLQPNEKMAVLLDLQFELLGVGKDHKDIVIEDITIFIKLITNLRNNPPERPPG